MAVPILILLLLVAGTTCLPRYNTFKPRTLQFPEDLELSSDDLEFHVLAKRLIGKDEPGFQYLFVDANGQISGTRGVQGTQIEIAGSPNTRPEAVKVAAHTVKMITAHMPSDIFNETAYYTGVGVYAADEKLSVLPEYSYLTREECRDNCDGDCLDYCLDDGRHKEDVLGFSEFRAAIREDNVLCADTDPFGGHVNILVHEFTHVVHFHALSYKTRDKIYLAYEAAKAAQTWVMTSYAMSNENEYLAEAATTFFGVSQGGTDNSGEMNKCGDHVCLTEAAARENLRAKDPALYGLLSYIYTDNHPEIPSGLAVCPDSSILIG